MSHTGQSRQNENTCANKIFVILNFCFDFFYSEQNITDNLTKEKQKLGKNCFRGIFLDFPIYDISDKNCDNRDAVFYWLFLDNTQLYNTFYTTAM